MSEFLGFLGQVELPIIIFMMVFSLGIAIFHTIILSALFNANLPGWFFFVVNPLAIGLGYLIYPPLGALVFLVLFALAFILGIVGGIYNAIRGMLQESKRKAKITGKKTSVWMIIAKIIFSLLFFIMFLFFGPYVFILIFAFIILQKILPNSKSRFLQLQATLPTANIRSMAMGLVEVKGKIKAHEPLISKMGKKKCIGYQYIIERISRDKDGKESFSTILNETVCHDFYIEDKTGSALVSGDSLEFLWLPISDRERSGGKRYTQYLLLEGKEMLLIGMATKHNKKVVIAREPIKNIFTISPINAVNKWNKHLPLLRASLVSFMVVGVISVLILLSNISIVDNTAFISLWTIWS